MNSESKFPPAANQPSGNSSGTLRWVLRFGFFLILFAVIALLVSYGVISLKDPDKPAAGTTPPTSQPTPATQASEPPVLPSGTAGHAAATPSPQR